MKVYKVRILTKDANETMLIRAKSETQAVRFAVLKHVEVTVATHDDAVALGVTGGKIEEAM
jgi:hypothetical protein